MNRREMVVLAFVAGGLGLGLYSLKEPMRISRETTNCQKNLKIIGLALSQYARDYDEKNPPASKWMDVTQVYTRAKPGEQLFDCPAVNVGYTYNRYYSRFDWARGLDMRQMALIFDSTLQTPNANDTGKSWAVPLVHVQRGAKGNNVLFADGHVKMLTAKPQFHAFPPR